MISGCDVSNYTGPLTPAALDCLKANGVEHVVVRASLESPSMIAIARQQLDACRAAGLSTSLYVWCYGEFASAETPWEPRRTVQDTVNTFGALATTRLLWLDVEPYDPKHGDLRLPSLDWLANAVDEAQRQGWTPGIYTGEWVWVEPTYPYDNSTRFAGLPLWNALFDRVPDLSVWTPYGGWTAQAAKQYAGSGQQSLCGLFVDLDVLDPALFAPPVPPTPPASCISTEEVRQWLMDDVDNTQTRAQLRNARLDEIEAGT